MMAIKFFIVAALLHAPEVRQQDPHPLFYGGLFLAVGVYLIALFTFRIFDI